MAVFEEQIQDAGERVRLTCTGCGEQILVYMRHEHTPAGALFTECPVCSRRVTYPAAPRPIYRPHRVK